jgi:septal ring factor EnvC (AmiA/AmiB activator)
VKNQLHERVVPFKVEMGALIEALGKANAGEVSSLARQVKDAETNIRQQDRVVTSLCDKYESVAAQLQVLDAGGRQSTDEQRLVLQKAKDSGRAEALVVLNERLKEEIDGIEDRLGKRVEDVEKRTRGVEKKLDASKADQDEQKLNYENLAAKLEDVGKLVAELTVSNHKDSKEDISKLRLPQTC